jgi:hypothetical protein
MKKLALALVCSLLALPAKAVPDMTKDQAFDFVKYHDYLNKEFRFVNKAVYGYKYINDNRKLEVYLMLDKDNVYMDSIQLTELAPDVWQKCKSPGSDQSDCGKYIAYHDVWNRASLRGLNALKGVYGDVLAEDFKASKLIHKGDYFDEPKLDADYVLENSLEKVIGIKTGTFEFYKGKYYSYFSLHRIEEEFSYREQVHNLFIFPLAAAERVVHNMKENQKTYDALVDAKKKMKPSTRNETGNL